MDPTLALIHAEPPALVTVDAALLPGMALPTIIPLGILPPAVRADWLIRDARAPIATRVAAALETDRATEAWALLRGRVEPIGTDLALTRALLAWQAKEAARLALPQGGRPSEVIDGTGGILRSLATSDELSLALSDVRTTLSALAWPRWLGPVILVDADDVRLLPRGDERLARPVLPLLRLSVPAGSPRRPAAAAAMAQLALDLSAPPSAGWPAWLRVGCAEVLRAIARGDGPGPRAMHARRQAAGPAALRALLTAAEPDPALAMALCAPLLHSKRRHAFSLLLDPLRHGSDSETAIGIAYGLTIDGLVRDP